MANEYKKIKISLNSVTLNGKVCACPIVDLRFIGSDISANCCYNPKTKTIEGKYLPNANPINDSNCIVAWIQCEEGDCGGQLKKFCLCTGLEGQCDECETCVNGICTDRCEKGQYCDGDKCTNCLPGTCENGEVCIDGNCQCPEGSIKVNGRCVQCDPETFDVPCKVCIDGEVFDKECTGACDPETDSCVDCLVSGQCTKDNECCVDKKCECCSGYTRDNCTGECVPLPVNPCKDESCGPCSSCQDYNPCTGYGSCQPKKCPANFVCYLGECIPECDCDGVSTCGNTSYCKEVNAFQCGCVSCPTDSCSEGDGSCEAGSDRNCICNPVTQQCEADPCAGVICPANQHCENGRCVDNNDECVDTISLEKIDDGSNCDLKGSANIDCCACPVLDVIVNPTVSGNNIAFSAEFSKDGNLLSDNQPTNNIAGNEEPTSGFISYEINYQNTTTVDGVSTNVQTIFGGGTNSNDFNGSLDTLNSNVNIDYTPDTVISSTTNSNGQVVEVVRTGVRIDVYLERTTAPNGCTYERQLLKTIRVNSAADYNSISSFTKSIVSTDCRKPLFIWSKNGTIIRKIYKDAASEGYYEDTLKGPDSISNDEAQNLPDNEGFLESCNDYELDVDCACVSPVSENVKFCNTVDNFTAEQLDPCGSKIQFTIPSTCDVNHNLQFRIMSNFGLEFSTFGSALGHTGIIEKPAPIQFLRLEMLCADGSGACSNQINFNNQVAELTPTHECPNFISFPQTSTDGNIAVSQIFVDGQFLGGFNYPIPASAQNGGSITYRIVWENGCEDYNSVFSWTCTCAGSPCVSLGYLCGTAIDNCGNIVECGDTLQPQYGPWACRANLDGFEERTVTTYQCVGGNITSTVSTETRSNPSCLPIITQLYRCVGTACINDNVNGTTTDPNCNGACVDVSQNHTCSSGNCVQDDNGLYPSLEACMVACSNNDMFTCTPNGCVVDNVNGTLTQAQCFSSCDTTLGFCCDNNVCSSSVIESQCNGTWSSVSCADAGCATVNTGACCDGAGNCSDNQFSINCNNADETFFLGQSCADVNCPSPMGCCCVNGNSTQTTAAVCSQSGGTFFAGSTCNPDPCTVTPTGACCGVLPNDQCTTLTQAGCTSAGGTYLGDNVPCTATTCGTVDCGCGQPVLGGGCNCNNLGVNPCTGAFEQCTAGPNGGCICQPV